jgi:hypothetical protein
MLLSIAPGAGPCGIPFGWCDMALFDIISTHEITVNIIQYLITIYITMIVGAGTLDGNHTSLAQRTDHKSRCFKCLMDRWRLMNACYWFKIMNAKSVGKL